MTKVWQYITIMKHLILIDFLDVLFPSAETETDVTPDKKLMTNLRKEKNFHERYTELLIIS